MQFWSACSRAAVFPERAVLANLHGNLPGREAWLRVAKRKHGLAHSKAMANALRSPQPRLFELDRFAVVIGYWQFPVP